jgi:uncharacterized protein
MSGGASKLHDLRKLSDAQAMLDLDVALTEMPGLPADRVVGGGPLHVHARFGKEQGYRVAHVELSGELQLVCQRCLRAMRWPVKTQSQVLLLESELEAEGAPVEWETYLALEGRVSLAALAAEELLLTLPIVPLHAGGADCAAETPDVVLAPERLPAVPTRPFADLRAMLEQGAKPKS